MTAAGTAQIISAIDQQANLPRDSYVQLDTIQTVSKDRFVRYLGGLNPAAMRAAGRKLLLALGLEDCV